MTFNMQCFNGFRADGRDYSAATIDLLPSVIGTKKSAKSIIKIAAIISRNRETVRHTIVQAHQRHEVYIHRWGRNETGPYFPCYKIGNKKDAKRPMPVGNAEKSRRYRQSEKGKTLITMKRNFKNRERRAYCELKSRDPLLAAVMGRTPHV